MSQIKFNKVHIAMGRNGYYNQIGVDLYDPDGVDYIEITGITGRGYPAKGWIKIPKENIDLLITELQKLK